ncbi:DNA-binding response OmpR family regulator [Mucilaginibacter yixingensis]|uniref:DNA-binding response OmpR family regulator n=1 Tax=Mucilaginibacter yixingensis TaxID=1295612 RepID=A0A2T5J909_9SPHI|nr:response regulator transcription factor [Mucilaginibacter yixingensis]PTQ96546.1 DNA-binding response OmpR family regulator [Mucilaginibacter yixingensis]
MKLLFIEDEPVLLDSIRNYFSEDGNICETATNLLTAREKISRYEYDCIVLDIGLPDGNGLEVLRYIKEMDKDEGVLIVSGRNSLDDRLSGLNLGADDYIIKPFHLAELKARIMAVHRRRAFKGSNLLQYDAISINLDSMEVRVGDHLVTLTRKEYDMLVYFIANKGKVITRNAIADHLWHDEVDLAESFDFIYTHIKNLRKKMLDHCGKDYFKTVYGIGYKFS